MSLPAHFGNIRPLNEIGRMLSVPPMTAEQFLDIIDHNPSFSAAKIEKGCGGDDRDTVDAAPLER